MKEDYIDYSEEISRKIEETKNKILSGEVSILDIELVSYFENLKTSLNIDNIENYSITYKKVFQLLIQKFEELKILINSLDGEERFLEFLKTNPKDSVILNLLNNCWIKPFNIETLSFIFLESSRDRLNIQKNYPPIIEHLDRVKVNQSFLLEVPERKFTEKMMEYLKDIKKKLPCSFESIFENELDQIKIYEYFVYILHLLQQGIIKFQKETNFLYI